jgi:hypothetical protein
VEIYIPPFFDKYLDRKWKLFEQELGPPAIRLFDCTLAECKANFEIYKTLDQNRVRRTMKLIFLDDEITAIQERFRCITTLMKRWKEE